MELDPSVFDEELYTAYQQVPVNLPPMTRENIVGVRAALKGNRTPQPKVAPEQITVDGPDGPVTVFVYRRDKSSVQPALVWIHGGGYILGSAEDDRAADIAATLDCAVYSVDYRLAPEHPFPAGSEDCYAVLQWVAANAASEKIDVTRIAIGGASAGSGMAAGVVLMNRDRGGADLCFQLLIYPMLDNLHDTASGQYTNHPVWSQSTSFDAWEMYLNGTPGADASPYAAAARAKDLTNLPPAFVCVGAQDLFRDEDVAYAQRLIAAGIPCELTVFPGLFHGAEGFFPDTRLSKRVRASFMAALKDGLMI